MGLRGRSVTVLQQGALQGLPPRRWLCLRSTERPGAAGAQRHVGKNEPSFRGWRGRNPAWSRSELLRNADFRLRNRRPSMSLSES